MTILAAEHDLCWVYHDHRPRLEPNSGKPYDYATLPYAQHTALYREGARYLAEREPYAGLLLSLHGTGIYNGRHGTDAEMVRPIRSDEEDRAVKAYLEDGESFRSRLSEQIQRAGGEEADALAPPVLWANYHLMQNWDRLGLLMCKRRDTDFEICPTPTDAQGSLSQLYFHRIDEYCFRAEPYPFRASPVTFCVKGRYLDCTTFADEAAYHDALDRAPLEPITFTFQHP